MTLTIPEEIVRSTRMSIPELSLEIAVLLFQKEKLTLGLASRLARMSQLQFQHLLASRKIPIHYDEQDFQDDLRILKEST